MTPTGNVSALAALAEDPDYLIEPPEGAQRIDDQRFCVVIGSERRWASVCRLRLPDEHQAFEAGVRAILDLTEGIDKTLWNIGQSARPAGLVDRVRQLGLRDPEPPFEPLAAAMVLAEEPPAATGIVVRRIATFEQHLAGLEIMLAADTWSPEAAAAERALARQTFERRTRRGSMQWLALVDGTAAGFALATRAPVGLYLAGGATLPEARGRGCYRALVHVRWQEAQRLGLPGLAVQAQYESSAPILRRLGFVETGEIATLRSPDSAQAAAIGRPTTSASRRLGSSSL